MRNDPTFFVRSRQYISRRFQKSPLLSTSCGTIFDSKNVSSIDFWQCWKNIFFSNIIFNGVTQSHWINLIVASRGHVAAAPPGIPKVVIGSADLGRQRHIWLKLWALPVGSKGRVGRVYFVSVNMFRYPDWSPASIKKSTKMYVYSFPTFKSERKFTRLHVISTHVIPSWQTVPSRGIKFQAMVGVAEDACGEGAGGAVLEHGRVRSIRRWRFLVVGPAPHHCSNRAATQKSSSAERPQRPQDLRWRCHRLLMHAL